MMQESFTNVEDMVGACRSPGDFLRMVDTGGVVHEALLRIEAAATRYGRSMNAFAQDWAMRLSLGNDQEAIGIQKDKNICMRLLYTICDRCKDAPYKKKKPIQETITEKDIVDFLTTRVIVRILAACLPLNRADALYRLKLPGKQEPGCHWYSQQDVDGSPYWNAVQDKYPGVPTINKRLVWLMDIEGLKLKKIPPFVGWMMPQIAGNLK